MIRPIVRDVFFLSQKSEPATQADLAVDRDLRDTLQANRERCVGMAANMIGVRKRVIIVSLGFADTVMYNPVLLSKDTPYHFKRNWKAAKLLLLLLTASVWTITIAHAEPAPVTVTGRPEESVSGPEYAYDLSGAHEVDGRQGVAWEDSCFYISGSTTLTKYDADWNLIAAAENPFSGFSDEVNHIDDIDVYNGELYAGVEFFMDGEAKNIQIAVYDALTLELTRTYPFAEASGQNEVSGIAVDPDNRLIWMCSWEDGESGRYLYRYALDTGEYLGKVHLQPVPQWIQGVACYDGCLYLTADDGTADLGEPDHVYRCRVDADSTSAAVTLERTLDDVILQGEIEGLTFDRQAGQLLVSYNRGSQIVLGMVKGFYEGYDEEIHEVYRYDMENVEN